MVNPRRYVDWTSEVPEPGWLERLHSPHSTPHQHLVARRAGAGDWLLRLIGGLADLLPRVEEAD